MKGGSAPSWFYALPHAFLREELLALTAPVLEPLLLSPHLAGSPHLHASLGCSYHFSSPTGARGSVF